MSDRSRLWILLILVTCTFAAFMPVLDNGFLNWGDEVDLVNNPDYRGLGTSNLIWMFTTIKAGHYQPLSWISFAVDHQLWGMNPRGYHLTALILHVACALLVYSLIRQLLALVGSWKRDDASLPAQLSALGGALLFSLHPLRVETVAWATERRGTLSTLFFLLAIAAYLRHVERPNTAVGPRYLRWAVAAFALSILAKEIVVTLPAILIVLDVYPLRRLHGPLRGWLAPRFRHIWREKVPFFALSAIGSAVAVMSAAQSGVDKSLGEYGLAERIAQSAYGLAFYLQKTLVPTGLSPLHAIPIDMNPWAPRFLLSAAVVLGLTAVLFAVRRRFPAGLAVWACYVILVSPVLGLFQTGRQIAAERYTYVPAVGISLLAAALLRWLLETGPARRALQVATVAATSIILVGLAAGSWQYATVWRDSRSLWTQALHVDPGCPTANNNMGQAMMVAGQVDEATHYFETSLRGDPERADTLSNLGVALASQGQLDEAIVRWESALRADPSHSGARSNLDQARRMQEAKRHPTNP